MSPTLPSWIAFSLLCVHRSIVVVGRLCNSYCHSVLINRYAVVKDEELFCCRINILPPAATLGTYQNIIQHRVNCFIPFQLNFSAKVLCLSFAPCSSFSVSSYLVLFTWQQNTIKSTGILWMSASKIICTVSVIRY